jgi:hypothetical protein
VPLLLLTAGSGYTATLLQNGKVLVAAGYNSIDGVLTTAELYDPASGAWTATGNLATARRFHTPTLLPNDKSLSLPASTITRTSRALLAQNSTIRRPLARHSSPSSPTASRAIQRI